MYANHQTDSMKRRDQSSTIQEAYNLEHDITPRGVAKEIGEGLRAIIPQKEDAKKPKYNLNKIPKDEYASLVKDLTDKWLASANLEFERAAELRNLIGEIKDACSESTRDVVERGGDVCRGLDDTPGVAG